MDAPMLAGGAARASTLPPLLCRRAAGTCGSCAGTRRQRPATCSVFIGCVRGQPVRHQHAAADARREAMQGTAGRQGSTARTMPPLRARTAGCQAAPRAIDAAARYIRREQETKAAVRAHRRFDHGAASRNWSNAWIQGAASPTRDWPASLFPAGGLEIGCDGIAATVAATTEVTPSDRQSRRCLVGGQPGERLFAGGRAAVSLALPCLASLQYLLLRPAQPSPHYTLLALFRNTSGPVTWQPGSRIGLLPQQPGAARHLPARDVCGPGL